MTDTTETNNKQNEKTAPAAIGASTMTPEALSNLERKILTGDPTMTKLLDGRTVAEARKENARRAREGAEEERARHRDEMVRETSATLPETVQVMTDEVGNIISAPVAVTEPMQSVDGGAVETAAGGGTQGIQVSGLEPNIQPPDTDKPAAREIAPGEDAESQPGTISDPAAYEKAKKTGRIGEIKK